MAMCINNIHCRSQTTLKYEVRTTKYELDKPPISLLRTSHFVLRTSLHCRQATIDHKGATGRVARFVGGEEGDHRGDLGEVTQAPQRDLPDQSPLPRGVVDILDIGGGFQRAWTNNVAANPVGRIFHRQPT